MLKTHEIAFKLGAIVENTFPKAFANVNNMMSNVKTHLDSMRKVKNPLSNISGDVTNLAKSFEVAKAKNEALKNSLSSSQSKTDKLRNSYEQAQQKCKNLYTEIQYSIPPTKKQADSFQRAIKESDRLKQRWQEARTESRNVRTELKSQSETIKSLGEQYEKAGAAVAKLKKQEEKHLAIRRFQEKSTKLLNTSYLSKSYMDSMIGLTMKMAHPIQKALEVEAAAAQVQKNIHFESLKEYKEWQDGLFKLSLNNPVSQIDLLHMAEQAGSSAIAKNEISGLVQEAAKLSAVMKISGEDATKLLIDWRKGLDLTQEQANSLADALVNLGDKSANSTSWISAFVAQAGQEAKMAGLAAEQTAAFGSAITGMQPEKAATGFIAIANAMTKGTKATKSQILAFTKLGINVDKLQNDMKDNAVKTINNVVNLIKTKIPKAQQSAISNALVGATGAPIMAQMINNQALVEKQLDIVSDPANYKGRVNKEVDIVNSSTIAQIQLLKNTVDSLQLTLAETFLPTIKNIISVAKEIVDDIKPWVEQNKDLLDALIPVGGALAGISIVVAGMTWLFSGTLAIAIKAAAAAMWLFNTALFANPITGVIAAIGVMSFALYKFFDKTKAGQYLIGKLVDGIEWLMDRVQKHIAMRVQQIIDVWNKVKEIAGKIHDFFTGDNKAAQINVVHQMGKNDLNSSIKQLAQDNKTRGNQSITYSAPINLTVNGSNPQEIKQATSQASQQAQSQFDNWYKQNRLAY